MPVRKTLNRAELKELWPAIEKELFSRRDLWSAQGWSIRGTPDALRVVVKVPAKLRLPRVPVAPIPVGPHHDFTLKPAVEATYEGDSSRFATTLDVPLAPGASIEVGKRRRERAGIAAVITIDDAPHLVTCGHAFGPRGGSVFLPRSDEPVAKLTCNFLTESPAVDAAVCALTRAGLDALQASSQSPTWFTKFHRPRPEDNEQEVEFWRSSEAAPCAVEARVLSFSTCYQPLFGGNGPECGFIEADLVAHGGDSGSALFWKSGAIYGLCSGRGGRTSFFTPFLAVREALLRRFGKFEPWRP